MPEKDCFLDYEIRNWTKDKQKLELLEQEKYQLELEKRRLRASRSGGEFVSMREREARAKEIKRARDDSKLKRARDLETAIIEKKNIQIMRYLQRVILEI